MAARGGGVRRKAHGKAQRNFNSWGVKWNWGLFVKTIKELRNNIDFGLGWLRAVAESGARPLISRKEI